MPTFILVCHIDSKLLVSAILNFMDKAPATKKDLVSLESRIDKKLDSLESRIDMKLDKIMNSLDGFVGIIDDLSTDNVIASKQYRDHEKRILKLESALKTS